MPRPALPFLTAQRNVTLGAHYWNTLDLIMHSDVHGKVPYSAYTEYLEGLIKADLEARGVTLLPPVPNPKFKEKA